MDLAGTIELVRRAVPGAVLEALDSPDMPTIAVDAAHLVDVCRVLRDDSQLQYAFLVDVTAVDRLPAAPRFEVVYHLACVGAAFLTAGATTAAPASRLRMKVRVEGDNARVASVTSVYPAAGWPEREVFEGHADLRRILMPDDWEGFPLRRDYPVQIRKDAAAWSPLQLTAEEFARNVRATRDQATKQARTPGVKPGTHD